MSGVDADDSFPEPPIVFVAADAEAFAARAVTLLSQLPPTLPLWALVGGVAVAINLAGFHRPTGDLDSVSLDGDGAINMLIGSGASRVGAGVELDDHRGAPVKFDVIDVSEGLADDGGYLAHRYGLDSAQSRRIDVLDRRLLNLASATIRVARPEALVVMKLHAIEGRRTSRPEKRSGDLYDIIRLTAAFGPHRIAAALRSNASPSLVLSARNWCGRYFVEDAARTLRSLRIDSRATINEVDRTDIELVAELYELLGTRSN
jgi:hypothetical protein